MDFNSIQRDIDLKKLAPVYLLWGEEGYFIDELEKTFENRLLTEAESAFNKTIAYGLDSKMDQILSVAKAYPMVGERQLVLVKEAQLLDGWRREEDMLKLEKYLDHPQPATVLVFAFRNKKPDGRLSVFKKMKKVGVAFESARLKEYKMADWVMSYVSARQKKIGARAANNLVAHLGAELSKIVNALDKLFIVVAETEITDQHIEENIGLSKDFNTFELLSALGSKDVLKANKIIDYFASNPKAHPVQMVLPLIYSFFAKVLIYHQLTDKGNAAKELGVPPYFLADYQNAARLYSADKAVRVIGYIRECDRKSKGVDNKKVSNAFLMKEMVYKILH